MKKSRKTAVIRILITLLVSNPILILTLTWIDPKLTYWGDIVEAWSYPFTVVGWALVIIISQFYLISRRFNTSGVLRAMQNPGSINWIWEAVRKLGSQKPLRVVHIGTVEGNLYRIRTHEPWIKELYEALKETAPQAYQGLNLEFQKVFRKNPAEYHTYEVYREQRVQMERDVELDEMFTM